MYGTVLQTHHALGHTKQKRRQSYYSGFDKRQKEWKLDSKMTADKKTAFAVIYGQLAEEAFRSEVQDHEGWAEAFINRDILFLIEIIRSTYIARQSGNPRQEYGTYGPRGRCTCSHMSRASHSVNELRITNLKRRS